MGTHPIFESDFDCLTDKYIGLQWPTQRAPPKSSESEPRSSTDIKLTDLCALMPHGENQSVLTPVSEDDSRANILCHLSLWYQGFRQTQMLGPKELQKICCQQCC